MKKKNIENLQLDDDAIFVSSEGIRCIEQAINSIAQAQKELKKAAEEKTSSIKGSLKK